MSVGFVNSDNVLYQPHVSSDCGSLPFLLTQRGAGRAASGCLNSGEQRVTPDELGGWKSRKSKGQLDGGVGGVSLTQPIGLMLPRVMKTESS